MQFSAFIRDNLDALVAVWEALVKQPTTGRPTPALAPALAPALTPALSPRDHCRDILLAIADDMAFGQTSRERTEQSQDTAPTKASTPTAAAEYGALRQQAGLDLMQLFAEFQALRASVMASWRGSEGADSGATSIADITRFNEGVDKALADSVQHYLSEATASRDMRFTVLGHELRDLLSGTDMAAILLARPDLSEAARQAAAARTRRAARDMHHLITDLLQHARTRPGAGLPPDRPACGLCPVCEAPLKDMLASNPERPFVQRKPGGLALPADAAHMHQALSKPLGNAVQQGNRLSSLSLAADGGADAIALKVCYSGDPIPREALQVSFEPLVLTPSASSELHERSNTSLGFGLFSVREIVPAYDVTIAVESSATAGTVFTIRGSDFQTPFSFPMAPRTQASTCVFRPLKVMQAC